MEWDHDDYLSVEPEFEAVLRSTESHDLIPALSVAEIMTCEQAELYSPEAMQQQLLDSSNTAVHVSELKMIIDNARETIRLKRVNAWNPFVRMAAPAEVEGPADKSQTAGEHAALEPHILPEGAYRVSLGNKYHPMRASEHEPERENRLTTSCMDGRSLVQAVVSSISRGTATEPYFDRHTKATVWEARHRSVISRTRMDVSGKQVTISQGTSTMSRIMQVDSNAAESTYHLLVSPAFDVPNGDFDGPLQGKFKLVNRDLDPQHQLQLEMHGWEVTSAGSGLLGSANAQATAPHKSPTHRTRISIDRTRTHTTPRDSDTLLVNGAER